MTWIMRMILESLKNGTVSDQSLYKAITECWMDMGHEILKHFILMHTGQMPL